MKRSIRHSVVVLVFGFSLCTGVNSFAQTNLVPDDQEFQALKALYDSLGGSNWTNKTNWPTPGNWPATATAAQMGTWFGVTVQSGDIFKVILSGNNLTGKVPAAVSLMSQVTQINLSSNHLTGSVPSSLGSLSKLLWLRFDTNQLTGTIPASLGNLPLIQHLYFDGNALTGTIPPELGNLSSVLVLSLSNNQLTGSIPSSFGGLQNVTSLFLNYNQLSGSIPESLGNLSHLITLNLRGNQLTESVPASLGNLTSLVNLYLDNNDLTGSIPASLGSLGSLQVLYLHANSLTGLIPSALGDLTNLRYLLLQQNKLSGSIPAQLGNLTNLIQLYLYENNLTGELPSQLGSLAKLQFLAVYKNQLTGTIPSSFVDLVDLSSLNVSSNKLSGSIPEIFGSMTKLTNLDLSSNNFAGAFPSSIGSCSLLTYLRGDLNKFTSLPASLLTLPVLNYINFEGSELNTIPDFSVHPNKANLGLWLRNNRLDFSRLEPLINAGIAGVVYNPQKTINDVSSVPLSEGSQLVLTARPTGQFSTVTWEKQNANGTWAVLTNDQDTNPQTYTRTTATLADEGVYRWKMTNTKVTGLTLQSDPITVKTLTHFVLDNLAFQYKYDARRRMTHKKVPGADWVYMVYDDRDRLVMTQDGEQRKSNKWSFTKYDALNRPVMTGIYTHSGFVDQAGMSGLISTTNFFETYTGLSADAATHGYSNIIFPKLNDAAYPNSKLDILTVTYYDNYDFIRESEFSYKPDQLPCQSVGAISYCQPGQSFARVTGQVTGTKVKTLATDPQWLRTVTYYDDKYRVIQTVSDNHQQEIEIATTVYDFAGKALSVKTVRQSEKIQWKDLVNISIQSDRVVKSVSGSTWGNSGGASIQTIPANTDGWIEFTCTSYVSTGGERMVGLSDQNIDANFPSIDYAIYHTASSGNNLVAVYEGGVNKTPSNFKVVPGDVVRIERKGTAINYLLNGVIIRSTTTSYTGALMADLALNGTSELFNARISVNGAQQDITRKLTYDHAGRLLKTWHQVNGGAEVLLVQNEYNELGQLVTKNLYNTDPVSTPDASRAFRQQLDYRYNIRGWLTRMNNSDVSITENGPRDYFGMNLFYNESVPELSGNQPQFNGNIAAMKWSTNLGLGASVPALEIDQPKENAYAFRYDTLNRLKSAAFHKKPSAGWTASTAYHEDNLKYDHNGNIKSLNRTTTEGAPMDQLTYAYNGNQLLKVGDASDKTKGFVDGPSPDNDYTYDANGNMTLDRNKDITAITYNHLNLPDKVTKGTGEYVKYTYDATGTKLSQGVYNASNVLQKKSDYAGEFFYENDTLKFINHEEGRVVMAETVPEYQYHLKDHLGNVRMTFTTKEESQTATATMEEANMADEKNEFVYYKEAVKVYSKIFDNTNNSQGDADGYAIRLTGGETDKIYGLAKSLSVMPGDTVKMDVHAKYVTGTPSNNAWGPGALLSTMTAISANAAGVVVDGGLAGSIGGQSFPMAGYMRRNATDDDTPPRAYLNWLVLNRQDSLVDFGYIRVTTAALETGNNGLHEHLQKNDLLIREPGYVYIYLSNEDENTVEVFFDDFRVEHVKSPVVQADDYYPFGATFNSYARESSVRNQYKYNAGSELQDELGLEIYLTDYRVYDEWGRLGWWQIDPKAESLPDLSPYNYSVNNPIRYNDPRGDCPPEAPDCWGQKPTQTHDPEVNPLPQIGSAIVDFVTDLFGGNEKRALNNLASILPGVQTVNTTAKIVLDQPVSTQEAIATAADVVNIGLIVYGAGGGKPTPVADMPVPLQAEVNATAQALKGAGKSPATVVGAELPNGARTIAPSNTVPTKVAASLNKAANKIGGVGTVRAGNKIGCCAEFHAGNTLLTEYPMYSPTDLKFTDAIRPRTGQVVPPCDNCKAIFGIK